MPDSMPDLMSEEKTKRTLHTRCPQWLQDAGTLLLMATIILWVLW
jgi:hypothetical protein